MNLLLAGAAVLSGCAFGDGNPWGIADVTLDVAFEPGGGRLTTDGWIKTSADYEVDITSMRVEIDAVDVVIATSSDTMTSFDPANPPPGYSLCHNGHCHAADGGLVDYAQIEAELAGGGGATSFVLRRTGGEVRVETGVTSVPLGDCSSPDCWLEAGSARTVTADVHALEADFTVRDSRSPPRIDPTTMSILLEREISIDAAIDEAIGDEEPVGLRVRARLRVPDQLFDQIDFSTVRTATAVADHLASNVSEHSELETEITRYDP